MKDVIAATLFSIILFLSGNVAAQSIFPELTLHDIPDGEITRSEYFVGSALYGLIDGGADLYFEYGFTKALVQEIQYKGLPFRIEIYQMNDIETAFGIFSISRHNQVHPDSLTPYSSQTPHQIRIAIGPLYISIANDGGTSIEQQQAKQLAKILLRKVNTGVFRLPKFFTNNLYRPYINNLKYVRGKLGLQNGFPMWENLFDGISFSSMYLLPIAISDTMITITQIEFTDKKDNVNFRKLSGVPPGSGKEYSEIVVDNTVKAIKEISPTKIIYIESNINDGRIARIKKYIRAFK
jgi:hypothetical protein